MRSSAIPDEISCAERLLADVFRNANVGFAVLNDQLRYLAVNSCWAAIHGVSAGSHLGKTLGESLGELASRLEPAYKQVLTTGHPVLNLEVEGQLPTKAGTGRWIRNLFPVTDANGKVTRICAVVTELPANATLEQLKLESGAERSTRALRSWKEIAEYAGACVKTVQRWEHLHGFPVRRLKRSKGSVVFAMKDELNAWMRERTRLEHWPTQVRERDRSSFDRSEIIS